MRGVIDRVDSLIVAPVQPPVTVDYAKKHVRSLSDREDELVLSWILAAASYFEEQTNRQLITATRELWLDRLPDVYAVPWTRYGVVTGSRITLPHPPLQTVVSVNYVDATGALVPFSDGASPETLSYQVMAPAGPYAERGWIEPLYGMSWPIAQEGSRSVRIQYRCGYGDTADDIPDLARAILCWLVGQFDQYRTPFVEGHIVNELPYGVKIMLDGFKYSALPGGPLR